MRIDNLDAIVVDRQCLPIWAVYDHPADIPDFFVARLHYALPDLETTEIHMVADDVEVLRQRLLAAGYHRLERDPRDEPQIMESWI